MSTGPGSPDRESRPRFKGPPPVPSASRPPAQQPAGGAQWQANVPPPPSGAWRPAQPPAPRQPAAAAPVVAPAAEPVRVTARRPLRTKRRSDTAGILAIMVMLLAAAGGLGYFFLMQQQKAQIAEALQAARQGDGPAPQPPAMVDGEAAPQPAGVTATAPTTVARPEPAAPDAPAAPSPLDTVSVERTAPPPSATAPMPAAGVAAGMPARPPMAEPPAATNAPEDAAGSPPAAIEQALTAAFAAIRSGDFDGAAKRLGEVAAGGNSQVQARLDRWRQFLHYARGMVDLRKRALAEAADGREYEIGDRVVVIVEMNDRQVIYRDRGKQHEVPRTELPAELEQAIVEQWLAGDGRAANHLFLGAGHLLRDIPSPADAIREWQTAAAGGEPDGQLLQPLARDPVLFAP